MKIYNGKILFSLIFSLSLIIFSLSVLEAISQVSLAQTPPRDAQFITQTVPTKMIAGQSYSASMTFRNTGGNTWVYKETYEYGYKLGSQNPQDNNIWQARRILLNPDDNIITNQEKIFDFTITAPITPGTHNFQMRMLQEWVVWFGDFSPNVVVNVTPPPIESVTINGAQNGFIQSDYTFVANVSPISTTQPITYIWQATGQSQSINVNALSDTMSFAWDSPGTQIVTVTAKNADSIATQSHTIIIDEISLTNLDVSGSTKGNIETEYIFIANVAPVSATQPITYVWQASEQSQSINVNGVSNVVAYTWNTTGTKIIAVTATNYKGAITNTHVITINAPPTKISISGPTEGLVKVDYSFTATVNPVTSTLSLPINYTWEATGLTPTTNVGGLSNIITFTWGTSGVKNITVMAENPGGVVTDTYSIAIYVPPTNISVNESMTGVVEAGHSFTATVSPITATLPITYVWQTIGQPSVENVNGLSDSVSFTWNVTGTQLITVSAHNIGGSITSNVVVNIIPKPPTVYLPLVLKRWPPIPYDPILNPITNADQDNYYAVSWRNADLATTYILEEATNAQFSNAQIVYQGSSVSWSVASPGKTPATYYYRVKARNSWGDSLWSSSQIIVVRPLFVGLQVQWDGEGYIRTSSHYDVGWHQQRDLNELTDVDTIRSHNNSWYDPNPQDWDPATWDSFYSVSTGHIKSSSIPSDPTWKWSYYWLLPYDWQFSDGQTVLIDSQEFIVSGPHSGYTAFGKAVQYWQLTNKKKFLYWDSSGDWTQYVHAGDITLWYDVGNTRLLLHRDVLRRYYEKGKLTSYTVQYISNLTSANSFP